MGDGRAFRQANFSTTPEQPGAPLAVYVDDDLPLVRAAVAAAASLTEAGERDHDLRVERAGASVHLLTRYGDQVMLAPSEQAAADALRQQPWIRRLAGGRNGDQRFAVDVPIRRGETYAEGDVLDLAISSDRTAYLLVVAVAPDGTFRVLHPGRSFAPTRPDTAVPFRTRVNQPFGIDHVVAVAFLEAPPYYDERLLASASINPGSRLHDQLLDTFMANDANQAPRGLKDGDRAKSGGRGIVGCAEAACVALLCGAWVSSLPPPLSPTTARRCTTRPARSPRRTPPPRYGCWTR